MKILAINGSPRKKSNTELLIKEVIKHFDPKLFESEVINLYGKKINHCLGCLSEGKCINMCIQKDDIQKIFQKLTEAEIIIIGSPIYGCNVSSLMKAFLDRMVCLKNNILKGKIGGIVVTGNIYGFAFTEFYMMNALNYQGVILPGRCTCEGRTTKDYGSIKQDQNALMSAERLAKSISDLSLKLFK